VLLLQPHDLDDPRVPGRESSYLTSGVRRSDMRRSAGFISAVESRFEWLQPLQFSRGRTGPFGTFRDAGFSSLTTRKSLNDATLRRFWASDRACPARVQIPSGTLFLPVPAQRACRTTPQGAREFWPWHFALRDVVRYMRRGRVRTTRCQQRNCRCFADGFLSSRR
jgi:hypothetical protein